LRLDSYLVSKMGVESRNKAQSYIKEGFVQVDGKVITKSAFDVDESKSVVLQVSKEYVSRAAWKLAYFLDETGVDVTAKRALDIGSSTGGFTEVLLERGAKSVTAVDVGENQLHPKLRSDLRVELHEKRDIREFKAEPFDVVVSDISFISLLKVLESIHHLAKDVIILLFKPQFEVGREVKRDKKGVVRDAKAIERSMRNFEEACALKGWRLIHKSPARIRGKEGNLEYCYYFKK